MRSPKSPNVVTKTAECGHPNRRIRSVADASFLRHGFVIAHEDGCCHGDECRQAPQQIACAHAGRRVARGVEILQTGGVEFIVPEGIEARVCHKGQGEGDADEYEIAAQDGCQHRFTLPPHADGRCQEGHAHEVEGRGEVECQSVHYHVLHVGDCQDGRGLVAAEHEHDLGGDEHDHRPQICL